MRITDAALCSRETCLGLLTIAGVSLNVLDVLDAFFELVDGLAEHPRDFRQSLRAEQQQHDEQNDQQLRKADVSKHVPHPLSSASFYSTRCRLFHDRHHRTWMTRQTPRPPLVRLTAFDEN